MSRPYQNRVTPSGELFAVSARGTMMGNRGGRIHNDDAKIIRNWASRQWICCLLDFKDRQRQVMGNSYTELFFLDEATALAAGHRPCFECRRNDAIRFAEYWNHLLGKSGRARAKDMDLELHKERLSPPDQLAFADLPSAAMFLEAGQTYIKLGQTARRWSFDGYGPPTHIEGAVQALTCPSIRKVLKAGYTPQLHPSAMG